MVFRTLKCCSMCAVAAKKGGKTLERESQAHQINGIH